MEKVSVLGQLAEVYNFDSGDPETFLNGFLQVIGAEQGDTFTGVGEGAIDLFVNGDASRVISELKGPPVGSATSGRELQLLHRVPVHPAVLAAFGGVDHVAKAIKKAGYVPPKLRGF